MDLIEQGPGLKQQARQFHGKRRDAKAQYQYLALANKVFGELDRRYPGPSPKVVVSPRLRGGVIAGVRRSNPGVIEVRPDLPRAAFSSNRRARNQARSTLVHEWAHTRQPLRRKKKNPRWATEGGAEAFERALTRSVYRELGFHVRPSTTTASYRKFSRQVRRRKGKKYVLKGQFQRRVSR